MIAVAVAVLASAGLLVAQVTQERQRPPVVANTFVHYPASVLKANVATLKAGGKLAKPFGEYDRVNRGDHDFQGMNFRNKTEDAVGIHMNYADLYVLLDGEATIHYGGTMEGGKEVTRGEFRGERIVGGTRQKVVAGDVASVPAGMPHIWEVEPGKTVTYMTMKILKQPAAQNTAAR
jgi:hypothetical protein